MASTREKVTGALFWTLIPRAVQMAISVFTSILIVRSLGKFDYGTLSVLRTLLSLATLFVGFGLGQALNRFVPELRIMGRAPEGRALLLRCLGLQSGLWALLSVVILALRPWMQEHYPTYADLLILGVLLSIAEAAAGTFSQYAVGSYRTREVAVGVAAGSLVLGVATALFLHMNLKVSGVLLGSAAGFGTTAVAIFLLLRGGRRLERDPRSESSFPWKRLLAYALPWIPNNLLNYVVWRQSETLFLGLYRSREEAGFFDIAYKLPQLALEFLPASVYPLLLTGFSETATVAKERMGEFISFYYRLLFFVVAPLSLLGLAVGDRLLILMYGEPMAPAGPYCQAFFVIFALSFFGTPLSMAVYVAEKVWINLLLNIGYAAVLIGLDLLLIPRYGLLGATLPTALVTAITPFTRYWVARRYIPKIVFPWRFLSRAYLASSPLLALWWLKAWVESPLWLFLLCLTALAIVALAYRLLRVIGPEERAFLARSHVPGRDWILRLL